MLFRLYSRSGACVVLFNALLQSATGSSHSASQAASWPQLWHTACRLACNPHSSTGLQPLGGLISCSLQASACFKVAS